MSLSIWVKNLTRNNNILDLVKQKVFYPYKYTSVFENFIEELPCKEKFYGS